MRRTPAATSTSVRTARSFATDGTQGYENEGFCRKMADRNIRGEFKAAKKTITRRKKA
jgi:hypothetical protein